MSSPPHAGASGFDGPLPSLTRYPYGETLHADSPFLKPRPLARAAGSPFSASTTQRLATMQGTFSPNTSRRGPNGTGHGRATMNGPAADSAGSGERGARRVATEVLGTYVARRRLLEKASQLAQEMRVRAGDMADDQERTKLVGAAGAADDGGGQRGASATSRAHRAAQYAQGGRRQRGDDGPSAAGRRRSSTDAASPSPGHSPQSLEITTTTTGGRSAHVKATTEVEELLQNREVKRERLDRLRGMQQTLAELNESAEEQHQARARLQRPPDTAAAAVEELASGAVLVTTQEPERAATAGRGSSGSPGRRTAAGRGMDAEALELRAAFHKILHNGREEGGPGGADLVTDPPPPSPPSHFSSISLAVALERLGTSLASLVEVTDGICVLATFKGREEEVNLNPHMQALIAHIMYTRKAYAVAARHLGHFEVGFKALLEGGVVEVNSLREKFLMRKEGLTAQEQREKQAEEVRNGLRTRLQLLVARMHMWQEVVLGGGPRGSGTPFAAAELLLGDSVALLQCGSVTPGGSEPWVPHSRRVPRVPTAAAAVRAEGRSSGGVAWLSDGILSGVDSRKKHEGGATGSQRYRTSHFGDFIPRPSGQDGQRRASTATATATAPAAGSEGGDQTGVNPWLAGFNVPAEADAALERWLAQRWGNPYVAKAVQAERQANTLLVLPPGGAAGTLKADGESGSRAGDDDDTDDEGGSDEDKANLARRSSSPPPWVSPGTAFSLLRRASPNLSGSLAQSGGGGGSEGRATPSTEWPGVLSPSSTNATGLLPGGLRSVIDGAAWPAGSSTATAPWSPEARAMVEARLLSLLQSLVRTIPTEAAGAEAEPDEPAGSGAAAGCRSDLPTRLAARASVNRLLRYLSQAAAKDKEREREKEKASEAST